MSAKEELEQRTKRLASYTAPEEIYNDLAASDGEELDPFAQKNTSRRIVDRESDYHARRLNRVISPERHDPFAEEDANDESRSYADVMREAELEREQKRILLKLEEKKKEAKDAAIEQASSQKKRRWDMETTVEPKPTSDWAKPDDEALNAKTRWDETPKASADVAVETPRKRSRWDVTPMVSSKKSRWDETPANGNSQFGVTPVGNLGLITPTPGHLAPMTPEAQRWEKDLDARNRPLTDEELDAMFPPSGYKILDPPSGYVPIRTAARKLMATPTPMASEGFVMLEEDRNQTYDLPAEIPGVGNLPFFKQEDMQHFGKLLDDKDESELSVEELKERKIMRLLLKIKNGTPPMRKTALRQITDKARDFGAGPLFNQILPLLMSQNLEDQERHLLVKVIDRILYKLDALVRPYVHKILVVIEPLLIDEDYFARCEGREIISNLSKAAGLPTMIATMRPDIDHVDEYVRNTTARAFSVVASAHGIPALLPFLKAVCKSKKSWQARHTGIKIVQQIAILMGCAVLPHLKNLVEAIAHGLEDEQQKVRTITALAIAALAEAAAPYGIESFDSVLKPLWTGIRKHRGKGLAAFLKAIGYIIPLMDAEYANYYTKEVMIILIREFQSPDEEMKKIVLKVVKQCAATDGVQPQYIKEEILPEFFKNFWVRRMALDRRNYRQVVETTVELAQKVGVTEIVGRIVEDLKDESEPYRKMVMETVEKVVSQLGAADIDTRLEEVLIDGILYAFQEQTVEDIVMLNGFGTVVNALGLRVKPYLQQITSTILWRLNNKSAKVRQQAADLISRIAVVMKNCGEEKLMGHLGVVLYEYLGEEYPEVLGSILGGLKSIVNVIGMSSMTPPIKDLLPRLTPILKNRHEKVEESCLTGDMPVLLKCGISRRIDNLKAMNVKVYTWIAQEAALGVGKQSRWLDQGIKETLKITLSDGRVIKCTPDHRLLTDSGDWVEARNLLANKTYLSIGMEGPVDQPEVDEHDYILNCGKYSFDATTANKREELLAFARLFGYVTSKSNWHSRNSQIFARGFYEYDAERLVDDIELLTGTRPEIGFLEDKDWIIQIPIDLAEAMINLSFGSSYQSFLLPSFVKEKDCPKAVLREFIAGHFGGKAVAPCCQTDSISHVILSECTQAENISATTKYMKDVKHLLRMFGIQTTCVSFNSLGNNLSSGLTLIHFEVTSNLDFAENIGFRYSIVKELRLSAASVYWRRQSKLHQKSIISKNFISHYDQKRCLPGHLAFLAEINASSWFANSQSDQQPSQFLLDKALKSFPTMRLKVIDICKNGREPVYDISVPVFESFLANGVVVHNCIDLVGRIADRGAEFVSAREWMRICFELLDMLKAHKKGIRRATVNTFGYIAKAIGPQDVLATLLNNLKVQERQNRVCTTVAIAIVAETCAPFTVLPALMNEYRVPELNVQNGVLKSLSFLFEYIGEMGKDYIYAVTPLLEDALMDRDLVHRQTACTTVKHMSLGVFGLGCEDALLHLLNYVWPNIFETSPHVINAVMEAIEGLRVALGPSTVLQYVLQGLFHPARKVREIYWKIYNQLYIGAQDALIPYYSRIEDDERNNYERYELSMWL